MTDGTTYEELQGLPQALKFTSEQAVKAAGVDRNVAIVALPNEPDGRYGLVTNDVDGVSFEVLIPNAGHRDQRVLRLDQVPEVVRLLQGDRFAEKPAVWFTEDAVIVIHDDVDGSRRLDRTSLKLVRTPEYSRLLKLGETDLTQKQLVGLLRITLADCATESSQRLLEVSKVLNSKVSQTSHGTIIKGRESLGRDIDAEIMSDVGELPDEVTFAVRLYDDPKLEQRQQIVCAVEWDPQATSCQIIPQPASLRDARDALLDVLGSYLAAECDCPIFHGTP